MARAHALSGRTNLNDVVLSQTAVGERLGVPDHHQRLHIPGMPEQRSFYYTAVEAKLARRAGASCRVVPIALPVDRG